MKTTYIFTIFFFFQLHSFAQVWVDSDASWHYNIDAGALFQGFTHYQYTSDSIIQGYNCQVIEASQHRATNYNNIYSHSDFQLETNYTYVNGDTVFWLVNDEFKVLYNFGAQVGDTWVLANANPTLSCLDAIAEVDSIGTIVLNGQTLRWVSFHTQSNSSYLYSGKAVERFGLYTMNYHSPHALFPIGTDCTEGVVIDYFFNYFTCFEDASFSLINTSTQDCEYARSLTSNELSLNNVSFNYFIDQENSILHLRADGNLANIKCIVYNNMGQIVVQEKEILKSNNQDLIQLPMLNDGVYYVVFQSDNFRETGKFLVHRQH